MSDPHDMTADEMRAIRLRVAPGLSQRAFARGLGYADQQSYTRYEIGQRPIPVLLAVVMRLLDRHPDEYPIFRSE